MLSEKIVPKYGNSFISRTVPSFSSQDVKKSEFQISVVARNLNEEQRSIILLTTNFPRPRRLQIHRYVEFSQNVGWKMLAMISLKMRNLRFEISLNLVFRMVIIP